MQIPEHWAEARVVGKVKGKPRVVRRFGWSDVSAEAAQQLAEARAGQALAELQAGRPVAPREAKLPYGDAGLPIREQVLARRGDLVITRNSYGAHCLNEPDVLFADLDLEPRLPFVVERAFDAVAWALGLGGLALAAWLFWHDTKLGCFGIAAGLFLPVLVVMARATLRRRPGVVARSRNALLERVRRVAGDVPGGRFVVYETPAGLRVLALHATFDPRSPATHSLFEAFGADPAYVQMCELQACFRARVSGKPWRMGVRHIRPRPGVWPVHPDRLATREHWIAEYEAIAARHAACRFREEIGTGRVHARCAEVQRVHDELSRARSGLPIA